MAQPNQSKPKDNNDDNEFATGYKEYALEAKQELQNKLKEFEKSAVVKNMNAKILQLSHYIEVSGKSIESFGIWLSVLGDHLSRFTGEKSKTTKTEISSNPITSSKTEI